MIADAQIRSLAEEFLAAWNTQDVEKVLARYTDDLVYRDPNTRAEITGMDALRHYLRKLLAAWEMHWTLREAYAFGGVDGAAILWHASFRRSGGKVTVEAYGMDLVLLRNGQVCRNEVHFDRGILAPLMRES